MKSKGNPDKKYLTRDEYFQYIDLMNSNKDVESIKLGIALFKQSKTVKHYRYSPVFGRYGQKWKLINLIGDFENWLYNTDFVQIARIPTLDRNYPELKRWMMHHTL